MVNESRLAGKREGGQEERREGVFLMVKVPYVFFSVGVCVCVGKVK